MPAEFAPDIAGSTPDRSQVIAKATTDLAVLRERMQKNEKMTDAQVKSALDNLQRLDANSPEAVAFRNSLAQFSQELEKRFPSVQKQLRDIAPAMPPATPAETLLGNIDRGIDRAIQSPTFQQIAQKLRLNPATVASIANGARSAIASMLSQFTMPNSMPSFMAPMFAPLQANLRAMGRDMQWNLVLNTAQRIRGAALAVASPAAGAAVSSLTTAQLETALGVNEGTRKLWNDLFDRWLASPNRQTMPPPSLETALNEEVRKKYENQLGATPATPPGAPPAGPAENAPSVIGTLTFPAAPNRFLDVTNPTPLVLTAADGVRVSFRKQADNSLQFKVGDGDVWITLRSADGVNATALRLLPPAAPDNTAANIRIQINGEPVRSMTVAAVRQRIQTHTGAPLTAATFDGSLNPFS